MEVIIEALKHAILFLHGPTMRRLAVFAVMGWCLYLLRDFMTVLLLTFIFIYIFNGINNFIYRHMRPVMPISRTIITAALYVLFLGLLVLAGYAFVPMLVGQSRSLVSKFSVYMADIRKNQAGNGWLSQLVNYAVGKIDVSKYVQSGSNLLLGTLTNIGTTGVNVLMSLILSLFFMLEKSRIKKFLQRFRHSRIAFVCDDVQFFFTKFMNSFGKVIQTQLLISFINACLSAVMLLALGFPYVAGLSLMIFILGLVPVVGVFISLVPLSIVGYSTGGFTRVLYVLILVAVLHTLESYVLNPKLMSQKTKMPVFFTFLVLLLSEHFMGVWGLVIGLPLTMFLLDVIGVIPEAPENAAPVGNPPESLQSH